jgi:hypothetical protein
MTISFGFEIVGTYPVDLEIDEEELQEEGWDEMTAEEKIKWLRDTFEYRMMEQAERECEFSTGGLDYIQIDGEEHWMH